MRGMLIPLMRAPAKNRQAYHPPRRPAFAAPPVPVRVAALVLARVRAPSLPGSDLFPRPVPAFASAPFSARPCSAAVAQWAQTAPPAARIQEWWPCAVGPLATRQDTPAPAHAARR